MKFYYSEDETEMLVQPADGRFYPFPAMPHNAFTEQEFTQRQYIGHDTYAEAQRVLLARGDVVYPDNPRIEIYAGDA